MSKKEICFAGFGFVDDVDLLSINNKNEMLVDDILMSNYC